MREAGQVVTELDFRGTFAQRLERERERLGTETLRPETFWSVSNRNAGACPEVLVNAPSVPITRAPGMRWRSS